VKTVSGKVVRHSLASYRIHAKTIGGGGNPSTWNFLWNWPQWSDIADFQYIFACSDSAV